MRYSISGVLNTQARLAGEIETLEQNSRHFRRVLTLVLKAAAVYHIRYSVQLFQRLSSKCPSVGMCHWPACTGTLERGAGRMPQLHYDQSDDSEPLSWCARPPRLNLRWAESGTSERRVP
eukprot:1924292-Rhodomonas_salina.1